jgi:hypothetical protein
MKRISQLFVLAAVTFGLCLAAGHVLAQDDGGGPGGPPGGDGGGPGGPGGGPGGPGGPGGFGNFDPAQFRQMMLDNIRERLEVKDDAEWTVLQSQIQKVLDARMQGGPGGGMGMMMGRRGGNGGPDSGPNGGPPDGNGQGPGQRGGMRGMQQNPEAQALQKLIDANASADDLKAGVAKLVEARKQRQATLEKAQSDLRNLLSVRQEAIAYSMGLL